MAVEVVRVGRNPLDEALHALGMTRTDFGVEHGFSKGYLLRISQGRHSNMSQRLVGAILDEFNRRGVIIDTVFPQGIDTAWEQWVFEHRRAQTLPDPVKESGLSPWARLVTAAGGVARMSALLAVPDVLVDRYYKGDTYQMPGPIWDALADAEYPFAQQLEAAMRKWGEDA